MKLLLDIGNSRLKWSEADRRGLGQVQAIAHEGDPARAIAALACEQPDAIVISSVMGEAMTHGLEKFCLARWQLKPRFARSAAEHGGLRNAYADPARLGVDRWLAMVAAWKKVRSACVVVDAGTALTVDVIDDHGQHLGGIIAAGLQTSRNAVLGNTRFDAASLPWPGRPGLGRDTNSCVTQGALLSCLGAISQAAAQAPGARKFLCGGDAEVLAGIVGTEWVHRPNLVLEGLASIEFG